MEGETAQVFSQQMAHLFVAPGRKLPADRIYRLVAEWKGRNVEQLELASHGRATVPEKQIDRNFPSGRGCTIEKTDHKFNAFPFCKL